MIETTCLLLSYIQIPCSYVNMFWMALSAFLCASYIVRYGPLRNTLPSDVVDFLVNHGKSKTFNSKFDLPKSYFKHFYLCGVIWNSYLVYVMTSQSGGYDVTGNKLHRLICKLTETISCQSCSVEDNVADSTLAVTFILYLLHTCRRLYECLFVSVFSKKATISLHQYVWGVLYYLLVPITVLKSGNGAFRLDGVSHVINLKSLFGFSVFLLGCYLEHKTLKAFAHMRVKGGLKSDDHGLPANFFMFDLVSCPHYLGEVLVYSGLFLMCPRWRVLVVYNVFAHVMLASSSHCWYATRFRDYPGSRKALVPYLL